MRPASSFLFIQLSNSRGLIGFFQFDLVAWLFGNMSWISRIVYGLVGICGLYLLSFYGRLSGD